MREINQNLDSQRSLPEHFSRGLLGIGMGALAVGAAIYQKNHPDLFAHAKKRLADFRTTLNVSGPDFVVQAFAKANSFVQPTWSKLVDRLHPAEPVEQPEMTINKATVSASPEPAAESQSAPKETYKMFASSGGTNKNNRLNLADSYDHFVDPAYSTVGMFQVTNTTNPRFHTAHAVDKAEAELNRGRTALATEPVARMREILTDTRAALPSNTNLSGCIAKVYSTPDRHLLLAGAQLGNAKIYVCRDNLTQVIHQTTPEDDDTTIKSFEAPLKSGDRVVIIADNAAQYVQENDTDNLPWTDQSSGDKVPAEELLTAWTDMIASNQEAHSGIRTNASKGVEVITIAIDLMTPPLNLMTPWEDS